MSEADRPVVFVVDDDKSVRNSLRWLLESVDLAVETYAAAETFLDAYDPSRSGCLVLDIRMPGSSGLDLHEKLQAGELALPVVIITGHADVPMAVRAMKAGAFAPTSRAAGMLVTTKKALRVLPECSCGYCFPKRASLGTKESFLSAMNRLPGRPGCISPHRLAPPPSTTHQISVI